MMHDDIVDCRETRFDIGWRSLLWRHTEAGNIEVEKGVQPPIEAFGFYIQQVEHCGKMRVLHSISTAVYV